MTGARSWPSRGLLREPPACRYHSFKHSPAKVSSICVAYGTVFFSDVLRKARYEWRLERRHGTNSGRHVTNPPCRHLFPLSVGSKNPFTTISSTCHAQGSRQMPVMSTAVRRLVSCSESACPPVASSPRTRPSSSIKRHFSTLVKRTP